MDEVDIDGEDYNELEARLYGQIHHEAANETTTEQVVNNAAENIQTDSNGQVKGDGVEVERIVTTRSVVNRPANASRVPDTRYWVKGVQGANVNQNKNWTNNANTKITTTSAPAAEDTGGQSKTVVEEIPKNVESQAAKPVVLEQQTTPQQTEQHPEEEEEIEAETTSGGTELLLNPAALVKNLKAKKNKKKKQIQPHLARTGPFQQQETKLQKAILIKAKKQKSQKVRDKKRKGVLRANETIVLESSEEDNAESDNECGTENDDDVVIVPTKPPPLITLLDSDNDEEQDAGGKIQLGVEENAMDSADVVIEKKQLKSNVTKPTEVRSNVAITSDVVEKRAGEQMPSRCASPSSVLSSDDFIGQSDRHRLVVADNCMADDQDLALLTADVDSLMQAPTVIETKKTKQKNVDIMQLTTDDVICTAEFTAPVTALNATTITTNASTAAKQSKNNKKQTNDYRVEQAEFRALDVYESESDINDGVYSKGAGGGGRSNTIINAIGSSSDADDIQQTPKTKKLKRLSKRRTSSTKSNRSQNEPSTDEDNDNDESNEESDGVAKTSVPYIMRGTAVERCSKKMRKRAQSLSSRRASGGGGAAGGTLSDTEFIATLNSLVQGHTTSPTDGDENDKLDTDQQLSENNKENNDAETNDYDEPTAEMQLEAVVDEQNAAVDDEQEEQDEPPEFTAIESVKLEPDEGSLASVQIVERPPPPAFLSEAVPDEAMAGLDKIFASIDNFVEKPNTTKKSTNYDNASSDEEIEVIQPPVTTTSEADANMFQNSLPLRHVVYSERGPQLGGIGWIDEMVKFYNCSWHGEHFSLNGVHNKMDKDRELWKIQNEDRFPKKRPYTNLKCYNCCEFGHTRAKCTRPKKPLVCYMCGESGHLEPRCPNTICLRCGNKTQVFTRSCNACTFQNRLICPICKVRGHAINLCPDKWRRYHSTTQPNAHPNTHIEFNRRKVCCVCGGVGHFSDTCRNPARFMDYPVIVSHVKSHQKSYDDLLFKTPRVGIAFNLLYRPGETYTFHMAEKTQPDDYYGRFLKVVGLGHLITRKRPFSSLEDAPTPSKKAKIYKAQYVPNPYCNKAREDAQQQDAQPSENVAGIEQESAPDQVQEVSGSVNEDEIGTLENDYNENDDDCQNANEAYEPNANSGGNEFKAPNEVSAATTSTSAMQNKDNLAMDSDSNYSFSEHFEMPDDNVDMQQNDADEDATLDDQPCTSAAAAARINNRSEPKTKRVREMDPLPDYIPLADTSDLNTSDDNFDIQAGISKRFVAADTADDDEHEQENMLDPTEHTQANIPCEAKIYLTQFHSNYLLSPDGHEFLVNKSKEYNIKARLDWTSVGHVLVIFGLPQQQDIFHKALLVKCHELMDQMNNKQMNVIRVPKRIDALIRFLRDNISQLQSDLGDVNQLQRRILNLEKTHTKANVKLAEKLRRLLNMILVGQAGLCDGNQYLDKLLTNLRSLLNDYQAENVVPQSLREEIDSHAKMIFTSYRHDNYPELIQTYNQLSQNQKNNINIDPLLLGQKMLDVTMTPEQRARLTQAATIQPQTTPTNTLQQAAKRFANIQQNNSPFVGNSPNTQKSKPKQNWAPFAGSPNITQRQGTFNNSNNNNNNRVKFNTNTPTKRQNMPPPPFINPQQKSTVVTKFHDNLLQQYSAFNNMIQGNVHSSAPGGGGGGNGKAYNTQHQQQQHKQQQQRYSGANTSSSTANMQQGPAKGPSVFWSRESMRYLDECLQLAVSNTDLLQKLQRIQSKSLEGALSYNDYRAVIKLHGAMVGN